MSPQDMLFAPALVDVERGTEGTLILRSPLPPDPPARCIGAWLEHWAGRAPGRLFVAERAMAGQAWDTLSYAETLHRVKRIASWILRRGLSAGHPLIVLSDNSIEHALLALAAMHVGVPIAAISPADSLISRDHAKLKSKIELLSPGAIYASDAEVYRDALAAIAPLHEATVIVGSQSRGGPKGAISFTEVEGDIDEATVAAGFARVGPETIARFLFTSGSTGLPKAVINTQAMLTSNQAAKAQVWPFLAREPPVILDWLPWSHTFGANHNFNLVLRNGGTLYIDAGKPVPQLFLTTLQNLREMIPTIYFNVPRGYDLLVSGLRADPELRRKFFAGVQVIFYAGAALPQGLWDGLLDLSAETTGAFTPLVSSWGATETAPLATDCHFKAERSGNIGIPVPGVEIKLVPAGDNLEIRVRGPNVTPGYWKAPELTANAFDADGFYMTGDAVRFADAARPEFGLFFAGRMSEDFKLTTGTWANVGALRTRGISALAPLAQDIVVTGHGHHEIGFLVFANVAACRALAGLSDDVPPAEVLASATVRGAIGNGLQRLRDEGGGSSTYATRALLMEEPPAVDAGEITDKGYINQRAVLDRRADLVGILQGPHPNVWIGLEG